MTIFDEKLLVEDVKKTILLPDFLNYLSYLKEKPAKLTVTGNLTRQVMGEISKFIPIPRHYLEYGWRLNNQQDWRYLDRLDALAEVGRFIKKYKSHKRLSPKGKGYLDLPPTSQYGELFMVYWEDLNWQYLFPYGEDKESDPVRIMYRERGGLLRILRDFERDSDGWISFFEFAEYIRSQFNLTLINYLGEDLPERVRDSIVEVFFEPLFGFGIIGVQGAELDNYRLSPYKLKKFRLTRLGEGMLNLLLPDKPSLGFFGALFNPN